MLTDSYSMTSTVLEGGRQACFIRGVAENGIEHRLSHVLLLQWYALCARKGAVVTGPWCMCVQRLFTPLIDSGLHQRALHSL